MRHKRPFIRDLITATLLSRDTYPIPIVQQHQTDNLLSISLALSRFNCPYSLVPNKGSRLQRKSRFTARPYSTTTTFTTRTLSEGFCFINPMTIMSLSCPFQMKLSAQSAQDEWCSKSRSHTKELGQGLRERGSFYFDLVTRLQGGIRSESRLVWP